VDSSLLGVGSGSSGTVANVDFLRLSAAIREPKTSLLLSLVTGGALLILLLDLSRID